MRNVCEYDQGARPHDHRSRHVASRHHNLFLADGEAASQEVSLSHSRFSALPGDPFRIDADWPNMPPREELDRTADLIRAAHERFFLRV